MKKRLIMMGIVLMIIIGLYGVSYSQDSDIEDKCKFIANFSERTMKARQLGMSIVKLMELIEKGNFNKKQTELLKKITIEAYERPHWNTENMKNREINDFRDEMYVRCVKGN